MHLTYLYEVVLVAKLMDLSRMEEAKRKDEQNRSMTLEGVLDEVNKLRLND